MKTTSIYRQITCENEMYVLYSFFAVNEQGKALLFRFPC